jgi:hypothetical protein
LIAEALPPIILPALSAPDIGRIRLHLVNFAAEQMDQRLGRRDYLGAWGSSS